MSRKRLLLSSATLAIVAANATPARAGPTADCIVQLFTEQEARKAEDVVLQNQLGNVNVAANGTVASQLAATVRYDTPARDLITLGGVGALAPTRLTNVANGTLSLTSTDAVNGSQLNATNQDVADLDDQLNGDDGIVEQIANLGNSITTTINGALGQMTQAITAAIAAIPPGGSGGGQGGQGTGVAPADIADMVEYDGPSRDKLTLQGGPAGTTIANVRAGAVGASSTEAINGSQLFATNQQVAQINTTVQNIDSSVSAIKQDVTTLKQNITDIQTSVTDLFDLRDQDRKDMKQGVASAMSMASAPVPSDVGMFSYAINGARFRGEYAVGASFMYRLNTEAPVAIGMGVSYAGNKNNGVRIGISGEF